MKILFFCPRWGSEDRNWNDFFLMVKNAGYNGVETGFPFTLSAEEKGKITLGLKEHGLDVIGQHSQTIESDFDVHMEVFKKHLYSLVELEPLFINSQTGKDYFTIEQNLALIQTADKISKESSIAIMHETHRGKWSFAAHTTQQYLQYAPQIRLTLDLSHWCNVAESLLADQATAVSMAIKHADHLHARVGFAEGPQLMDPRSPENESILQAHLAWWDQWIAIKEQSNAETVTITPEYGAAPYQHRMPYTQAPITSQWDINMWMKDLLKDRYSQYQRHETIK